MHERWGIMGLQVRTICTQVLYHIHADPHTCTHMHAHMHTHMHTHAYIYTHAHTCTHMHNKHTHMHTHAHTCIHMHTHAHGHTLATCSRRATLISSRGVPSRCCTLMTTVCTRSGTHAPLSIQYSTVTWSYV